MTRVSCNRLRRPSMLLLPSEASSGWQRPRSASSQTRVRSASLRKISIAGPFLLHTLAACFCGAHAPSHRSIQSNRTRVLANKKATCLGRFRPPRGMSFVRSASPASSLPSLWEDRRPNGERERKDARRSSAPKHILLCICFCELSKSKACADRGKSGPRQVVGCGGCVGAAPLA